MPLARPTAAVLALEPHALLSHRSAAAVWGLAPADPQAIDVAVWGRRPRGRVGVRVHRLTRLHPADTATHSNVPLTSLARTLIDFATQATSSELHHAFGDARAKHGLRDAALKAALARAPANHPGAAIVRVMLREGATYDRSEGERMMRKLCRHAQLPQPSTNVLLNGFLVDFLWPDRRLILEVDGYRTHGSGEAFEADRHRDQVHAAGGYAVVRITLRQLRSEPLAVVARLAQALAHRAA